MLARYQATPEVAVEQIMLYYQRGIVNASFVAVFACLQTFCTALTVLLIVVVALGLHVQIQNTQHSIVELSNKKSLLNASSGVIVK